MFGAKKIIFYDPKEDNARNEPNDFFKNVRWVPTRTNSGRICNSGSSGRGSGSGSVDSGGSGRENGSGSAGLDKTKRQ